jgi:hypothetical protein
MALSIHFASRARFDRLEATHQPAVALSPWFSTGNFPTKQGKFDAFAPAFVVGIRPAKRSK